MLRRSVVGWIGAALMVCACSGEGSESPQPQVGQIDEWELVRDSVVASIESPAREQQLDNARVIPAGGSPIPIRRFVLKVDVFTDLDCAACDEAERVLADALRKFPVHTRGLIHLPSAEHRWSMQAAKAFDCAYDDGQGSEMYQALRKRRSEFARMSWDSLAKEVDVYDLEAFQRCMAEPTTPRIEAGISLAKRLGFREAPAVVVDGWLVYPVTLEALTSALEKAARKRREGAFRW